MSIFVLVEPGGHLYKIEKVRRKIINMLMKTEEIRMQNSNTYFFLP